MKRCQCSRPIKTLRWLDITDTKITPAGVERLQKSNSALVVVATKNLSKFPASAGERLQTGSYSLVCDRSVEIGDRTRGSSVHAGS